jgi:hypothetical protein
MVDTTANFGDRKGAPYAANLARDQIIEGARRRDSRDLQPRSGRRQCFRVSSLHPVGASLQGPATIVVRANFGNGHSELLCFSDLPVQRSLSHAA